MDNTRTRHLSLVTSTLRPGADTGGDPNLDSYRSTSRAGVAAWNRLSPQSRMALAGCGWPTPDDLPLRGAPHEFGGVPDLDQPPMAAPPRPSAEIEATAALAQVALALYPQPGGRLEREHGQRFPGRTPDDSRLGRSCSTGPAESVGADGTCGAPVPRFRLLRLLARRAMAQYLATLSRVPLGPSKS